MLFLPQQDWLWGYNDQYQVLSAHLGAEMEFLTPYTIKQLIPDAKYLQPFTMAQARYYIELIDSMKRQLSLTDALIVQIGLNGTAAKYLLTPQMPKSWFFNASQQCVFSDVGKVVELVTTTNIRAKVLIVDTSLQAASVMLLDESRELSEQKVLHRF
ncbi:MAG: cell division protein ZapC domain-containing protein, partial [Shewanella sp.]